MKYKMDSLDVWCMCLALHKKIVFSLVLFKLWKNYLESLNITFSCVVVVGGRGNHIYITFIDI